MSDENLLPLEPGCPHCHGLHDVGEAFDGAIFDCGNCGKTIVAVAYGDYMSMTRGAEVLSLDSRSGRQRTRARWNRQGRR